jgi:hypothetical protein
MWFHLRSADGTDRMSLGMVFKGPEGIVLAADSRVTISLSMLPGGAAVPMLIPATYDNATKLLKVNGHDYVAAITYGIGAIGQNNPRTAHSFLPEFEEELTQQKIGRLTINDFAQKLGDFFQRQWRSSMPATGVHGDMVFLVSGYNDTEPYGRVYQVGIPRNPIPTELNQGMFGLSYGGQVEITARILNGFDDVTMNSLITHLNLASPGVQSIFSTIRQQQSLKIPYQFLPLQDCVDLTILLINTTAQLMRFTTDVRGVGGPIDVATITRTEGFRYVQSKQIHGERNVAS